MTNLNGLAAIVSELRAERTNLVNQIKHVDAALSVLGKLDNGIAHTEPRRRTFSASTRRKMRLAQRARWARAGKGSQPAASAVKKTGSVPVKRTISAAGRKRIAAFQRARWAKWKAKRDA